MLIANQEEFNKELQQGTIKPINEYNGYYISTSGVVYSFKRNKNILYQLQPTTDANGYYVVCMKHNSGKYKNIFLHRIVAITFIKRRKTHIRLVVNHIDGNKQNNSVTNLEWVTQRQNIKHACTHNLKKSNGARSVICVFPNGDEKTFPSILKCAEYLNVTQSTVACCVTGLSKSAGGCQVYYADQPSPIPYYNEKRVIKDWPDYEITDTGIVISNKGRKPKQLKPCVTSGYLTVELRNKNSIKMCKVHRLVAITFLDPPETSNLIVNHKDGNRLNNNVNNLEWISFLENSQHAINVLRRKGSRVRCIDLSNGNELFFNTIRECANYIGMSPSRTGVILRRYDGLIKNFKIELA